jgi:hypothetical protein
MPCGCRKNTFKSRSAPVMGPSRANFQPSSNNKIIAPANVNKASHAGSQTPTPSRNSSSESNERRKIQNVRRDAIKRAFNK